MERNQEHKSSSKILELAFQKRRNTTHLASHIQGLCVVLLTILPYKIGNDANRVDLVFVQEHAHIYIRYDKYI